MTTTIDPPDRLQSRGGPGWSIAVDLTPPEVHERRRLRGLRRAVVAGLVLVVMACLGGFAVSLLQARTAEDALTQTQASTDRLRAEQAGYADVMKVLADTRALDTQIADLMKSDVDAAQFLTDIRSALPGSMSLTSVTVSLTGPANASAPGATVPAPAAGGAVSGTIGTVTLAGNSRGLSDLATFASNMQEVDGVVDVLPATNASGVTGSATWTLTMKVTDSLYSHRYDGDAAKESK